MTLTFFFFRCDGEISGRYYTVDEGENIICEGCYIVSQHIYGKFNLLGPFVIQTVRCNVLIILYLPRFFLKRQIVSEKTFFQAQTMYSSDSRYDSVY